MITLFEETGRLLGFAWATLVSLLRHGVRWNETLEQVLEIGVRSSGVIVLTALFTGLVFALQIGYGFSLFQAEGLIGSSVLLSLTRELSPVLCALMVTGRAGSAMATELGTMRVTEQIDALYAMAVPPLNYLVVPRVLATTVAMPLLTVLFNFVGFLGAYLITIYQIGVGEAAFFNAIYENVDLKDLYSGLLKAAVFGLLLSLICTSRGFYASGGAKGVGLKTTEAVVVSSVVTLIADYFLTAWIFG